MAERKCTACGSTDLSSVDMINLLGIILECGRPREMPESYACNVCGHIDMYAKDETLNRFRAEKTAKAERDAEAEKIRMRLDELNAKRKELEAIISDENQTVKAVKQAEIDLSNVRREINDAERALNSLGPKRVGMFYLNN